MTDFPRFSLNRGMVVLRHKQPFLDWLNSTDPTDDEYTFEDVEDDGEVFLLPDYESARNPVDGSEDAVKWVEKRWKMFFEHVLGDWVLDASLWPKKRSLKMFREWFSVEYRSLVWDMVREPLIVNDLLAEDDEGFVH